MTSLVPAVLERLQFTHDLVATIREIGEGKGKQELFKERAPDVLENLKQVAIIESTESSNRLEGVTVPRSVLRKLVKDNEEPKAGNRSEGEVAGYRNVLSLIHERHENIDFTPNVIMQLHRDLFKFSSGAHGGAWKTTDNLITERRPDGTVFVRFEPVPAWRTADAMQSLHDQYVEACNSDVDAVILIALYILDFLCIHPFSDGNGRMVRLLTVLLLYREDYDVGKYISLERLIESTKDSYYETLYVSSQGWHGSTHNPMPWVSYFLSIIKAAYSEFSERVGDLREGRGMKTQMVLQAVEQTIGDFSISELHQRCPTVGWDMLRHVLRSERDAGRLEVIGRGRGARWRKCANLNQNGVMRTT